MYCTKRQATQHDCLPSLLNDGDKGIEYRYGEEKIFCTGPTRAAKNPLFRHDKPNEPTNEGPLAFVLCESPLSSVSAVSRGHTCLVVME